MGGNDGNFLDNLDHLDQIAYIFALSSLELNNYLKYGSLGIAVSGHPVRTAYRYFIFTITMYYYMHNSSCNWHPDHDPDSCN